MATSFGFQIDEDTLKAALAKIEACKRARPDGQYVLQFSTNLVPDGIGYDAYGMTLLVIDARLQEADKVTCEEVQPMTYEEYKQLL
jgi:hypothetical protein